MLKTIRELGVKVSLIFDPAKVAEANKSIATMATGMKTVGLAVASTAATLFGFAGATSSNARNLEQVSNELGINVERFQELEYAMKVAAGVSREDLSSSLEGLSKTLFEARNNNIEAAQTFIRMGVPLQMITDKTVTADQVLLTLANRFKDMPNGMYKTGLAAQLGVQKMLPALNMGAAGIAKLGKEGRALGAVLSESAVKQGAEFDRQWSKVWIVLKNITYLIGGQLIKYLRPFVMEFQKFIVLNRQFLAIGLATGIKSMGTYLEIVLKVISFVAQRFKYLIDILGGVERVSKLVAIAFGLMTAVKIVGAIGTLITAFRSLAMVMGIIEAPAVLIGAALLALFLVIQDLFSNDSIIKEWAGEFEDSFPNITKIIKGLIDQVMVLPQRFSAAFDIVKAVLRDTVEVFDLVFFKWTGLSKVFDKFAPSFSSIKDKISGAFTAMAPSVGSGIGAFGDALSANANARASAGYHPGLVQGGGAAPQTNNMTANVNVTVPHGTSVADATSMVANGTEQGFLQSIRQTRDQHLGGVSH